MPAPTLSFDIFCRVIDNFGDAGVCWRLARQLASLGQTVRLWIDAPAVLAQLEPRLDVNQLPQTLDAVYINHWQASERARPATGAVVIEAFGCELPAGYAQALAQQHCLWLNLEYLSAEPWIDDCHGLTSVQADGQRKYFYFPGFSTASGGLLREPELLQRRARVQAGDKKQRLRQITGLNASAITADTFCVLLFCYPHAPLDGLLRALAQQQQPTMVMLAGASTDTGLALQRLASRLDQELSVQAIEFVNQDEFDELLWCCDLNFVRGEDSWVRSVWASVPSVWQAYPQADQAHMQKLNAWLATSKAEQVLAELHLSWNSGDDQGFAQALTAALLPANWLAWQRHSERLCQSLAAQDDLSHRLLKFCQQNLLK